MGGAGYGREALPDGLEGGSDHDHPLRGSHGPIHVRPSDEVPPIGNDYAVFGQQLPEPRRRAPGVHPSVGAHALARVVSAQRREIEALLAVPAQATWIGRRDHALLQLAIQTGLRLAEIISLDRSSIVLGQGSHVRCIGKGRKERCTPLTRPVVRIMKAWLAESQKSGDNALFQTIHGSRLSADTVQYLVAKHVSVARTTCPSMRKKHITPHVLRHSAAMELLQAGVDSSVIAMWLGHESSQTTQMYLHAHMALKEAALAKVAPLNAGESIYYQPEDQLLKFLTDL